MKAKVIQYASGVILAVLLFAFVSWGDFSWVTLTGPISLEPDLEGRDTVGYVASPALQAVIVRLLFLLACVFFCMIPNLARGMRQNARYLLGLALAVYLLFSSLLGSFTFFASSVPGASRLRIAVLVVYFILLVIGYDTARQRFKTPGMLVRPGLLLPLAILSMAVSVIVSIILQSGSWLFAEHIHFVLLRVGVFLTALTGALAFSLWRGNN